MRQPYRVLGSLALWATLLTIHPNHCVAQGLRDLQGKVVIDGSSTVAPITIQATFTFRDMCPKVNIPVGISGTGGGFKRFTRGETDISDASRPIKFTEFQSCRNHGVQFIELPVAYDGLTIAVSESNWFVEHLTIAQLRKIFRSNNKDGSFINAKKWSDVDSSWPQLPIKIFAPGTDSGTFDYFKEVVVGQDNAGIRADISVSEDDNRLVQGIANTHGAIGFFGASYYFANKDKLKAVKIVNPETAEAVDVSPANIESGKYAPFSRPLFIYVNSKSARRPEVKTFINHYLDNAADLAAAVQFVGLPKELYERAKDHFNQCQAGTHFWQEDGSPRKGPLTELYTKENLLR
jgi:phosphate transport system substrate-binding protein